MPLGSQALAIIRAWNVKAAVLLQQERRRIGKGSLIRVRTDLGFGG